MGEKHDLGPAAHTVAARGLFDFTVPCEFTFLFVFVSLSGGFYKNAFFYFFDEESVLVTSGVLCPCYKGKTRSGPSGAHRGNQRPV